jgi:hypothetical protein
MQTGIIRTYLQATNESGGRYYTYEVFTEWSLVQPLSEIDKSLELDRNAVQYVVKITDGNEKVTIVDRGIHVGYTAQESKRNIMKIHNRWIETLFG